MLFCYKNAWICALVLISCPSGAFADKPSAQDLTGQLVVVDTSGLDFDTAFKTYIGPIKSAELISNTDSNSDALEESTPINASSFPPSSNISLSRISELRVAGAFSLAESLLVARLSDLSRENDWFEWYQELFEILDETNEIDRLIESLLGLVGDVDGDQRLEVLERLVRAHQKNDDFESARDGLRNLYLSARNDPVRIARLRYLLIELYLESGALMDAEIASLRYQAEYLPDDTIWNLLRGQILLESGNSPMAVAQLVGLQDKKARLMLLLARLREGSMQPHSVIKSLQIDEDFIEFNSELDLLRAGIVVEAAKLGDEYKTQVRTLERMLAAGLYEIPMLAEVTPERLLNGYYHLAVVLGNEAYPLLENNGEWLHHGESLPKSDFVSARAIYALLLSRNISSDIRNALHRALIKSLLDDELYGVVVALYGDNAPLGRLPVIDDVLALRLSNRALEAGDYSVSAEVATQIKGPPVGMTRWNWQLQVARLQVFADHPQAGAQRLLELLDYTEDPNEEELDALLQVAFDLQAISHHDLALKVFESVGPFVSTLRQRRELLFWMGESQIAQGLFSQGADLFLQSADVEGQALDLWGQSARFRAAEALVNAGLLKDAFNVYRGLLKESSDKKRRLQLQHKLQNLNLLEAVSMD